MCRSYDATTSFAVNGVPSENFTPDRSLNTQVFGSGFFQEVASTGTILPSSTRTSGSMICWIVVCTASSPANLWVSSETGNIAGA